MSSPHSKSNSIHEADRDVSAEALAIAAELRVSEAPQPRRIVQLTLEHDKRQKFRRLIDPGILRPNSKEQAKASIEILLTISENLLRDPDNPKYQRFKTTNNVIKRNLIDTKGALEYAIELGFRPEVSDFQPYYKFNPRHLSDLQIGASVLRDAVELEKEKAARAASAKQKEKENAQETLNKVKLAYLDDRKTQLLREEREKAQRSLKINATQETNSSHSRHPDPIDSAESNKVGEPLASDDDSANASMKE